MLSLKVTNVGSSSGIILTKEAMARLKVREGDILYLTDLRAAGIGSRPTIQSFCARQRSPRRSCATTERCCERYRSDIGRACPMAVGSVGGRAGYS